MHNKTSETKKDIMNFKAKVPHHAGIDFKEAINHKHQIKTTRSIGAQYTPYIYTQGVISSWNLHKNENLTEDAWMPNKPLWLKMLLNAENDWISGCWFSTRRSTYKLTRAFFRVGLHNTQPMTKEAYIKYETHRW